MSLSLHLPLVTYYQWHFSRAFHQHYTLSWTSLFSRTFYQLLWVVTTWSWHLVSAFFAILSGFCLCHANLFVQKWRAPYLDTTAIVAHLEQNRQKKTVEQHHLITKTQFNLNHWNIQIQMERYNMCGISINDELTICKLAILLAKQSPTIDQ